MRLSFRLVGVFGVAIFGARGQQAPVLLGPIFPTGLDAGVVLEAPRMAPFKPDQICLTLPGRRERQADRIVRFRDLSRRMALVIAVDVSGSMRGVAAGARDAVSAVAGEFTRVAD